MSTNKRAYSGAPRTGLSVRDSTDIIQGDGRLRNAKAIFCTYCRPPCTITGQLHQTYENPVKCIINGRFLTRPITGVERYARQLLTHIDQLYGVGWGPGSATPLDFVVYVPRYPPLLNSPRLDHIAITSCGTLQGHLWEQIELPYHARNHLLLCPCNTAPVLHQNKIVTIHDASVCTVPTSYSFAFRQWYKILLPLIGKTSLRIITVSEFSKKDINMHFGVDNAIMRVVHHGSDHLEMSNPDCDILKTYSLTPKKYILSVGTNNKNRNFYSFAQALEKSKYRGMPYVIAGSNNSNVFSNGIAHTGANTVYVNHLDDSKLVTLYRNAALTAVPSFYDSFGFPAVESMWAGTPVLASNSSALPEICQNAALYFDPSDITDITNKINLFFDDNDVCNQLSLNASRIATRFSWDKCARQTVSIINDANERFSS